MLSPWQPTTLSTKTTLRRRDHLRFTRAARAMSPMRLAGHTGPVAAGPTCDVITVTFNARTFLRHFLATITEVAGVTTIRIVDNASTDGTTSMVFGYARASPRVKALYSEVNLGFGRACNVAAHSSSADFLAFINPDVFISNPRLLTECVDTLSAYRSIGIVGCSLLRPDGSPDHAARRGEPTLWNSACYFLGLASRYPDVRLFSGYLRTETPDSHLSYVDAVNGAFLVCRRTDFIDLGGFDEDFWLYGEDLDLCRRFRESGRRVAFRSDLSAIHLKGAANGGQRPPAAQRAFFDSMSIYYSKHHPRARVRSWLLRQLIQARIRPLSSLSASPSTSTSTTFP